MAIRGKMPREERAKQFMPFAALKGYEEALRETEKVREQSEKMLWDGREVLVEQIFEIEDI